MLLDYLTRFSHSIILIGTSVLRSIYVYVQLFYLVLNTEKSAKTLVFYSALVEQ